MAAENAYVHCDRNLYMSGERMFFKLYVSDVRTGRLSTQSKVAYLVLRDQNSHRNLKQRIALDQGMGQGSLILPDTLKTGNYQLLGFTSEMRNQGEDSFFKTNIQLVNRYDKTLELQSIFDSSNEPGLGDGANDLGLTGENTSCQYFRDTTTLTEKGQYGFREKVRVDTDLSLILQTKQADLSVSVYEIPNSSKRNGYPTVAVLSPEIVSKTTHTDIEAQLPGRDKTARRYFSAEAKAKLLNGQVLDVADGSKSNDLIITLSCMDSLPNLQYSLTDENGCFQFYLSEAYEGRDLFISIMNPASGHIYDILTDDEFALVSSWQPRLVPATRTIRDFVQKSQDLVYIQKVFGTGKSVQYAKLPEEKTSLPPFHRAEHTTFYPSEFEPLPNLMEICVELLPRVKLIKSGGIYHFELLNNLLSTWDKTPPAVFLDGVMLNELSPLIYMGSDKIKKIEVISDKRIFGDLTFGGLVSIYTYDKLIRRLPPRVNNLRISNDRKAEPVKTVSLNAGEITNAFNPAMNQMLYWNPELKTENGKIQFEFYTSDNAGSYRLRIEGLSKEGKRISIQSDFGVNYQNR